MGENEITMDESIDEPIDEPGMFDDKRKETFWERKQREYDERCKK